jgi:hypothetical protein
MTDTPKIRPALTAEEWERGESDDAFFTPESWGNAPPGELWVFDDSHGSTRIMDRHGLAALALHEQPFGFTHRDMDILRDVAELCTEQGRDAHTFRLSDLADRIAALLPPEE